MNQDPEDPTDPMEALLIKLIDRYIVFNFGGHYNKSPLRTKKDSRGGWERVFARENTLKTFLGSASGLERLFTEYAVMVPSDLRDNTGPTPQRPWQISKWVSVNQKIRQEARLKKESPTNGDEDNVDERVAGVMVDEKFVGAWMKEGLSRFENIDDFLTNGFPKPLGKDCSTPSKKRNADEHWGELPSRKKSKKIMAKAEKHKTA